MQGTLKEEERFRKLKTEFREKPNDPKINAEIAIIYVNRGNLEKGKPLADKAFKLDPDNKTGLLPELHFNMGFHYAKNPSEEGGKDFFREAETHFKTVIEKYPQSAVYDQAQYYLGITYALQEKYQQAIEILEKLSDSKNEDIKTNAAGMLDRIKTLMTEPH